MNRPPLPGGMDGIARTFGSRRVVVGCGCKENGNPIGDG